MLFRSDWLLCQLVEIRQKGAAFSAISLGRLIGLTAIVAEHNGYVGITIYQSGCSCDIPPFELFPDHGQFPADLARCR